MPSLLLLLLLLGHIFMHNIRCGLFLLTYVLDTLASPVNTAEPIVVPFRMWTRVIPTNNVQGGPKSGATDS